MSGAVPGVWPDQAPGLVPQVLPGEGLEVGAVLGRRDHGAEAKICQGQNFIYLTRAGKVYKMDRDIEIQRQAMGVKSIFAFVYPRLARLIAADKHSYLSPLLSPVTYISVPLYTLL